MRPLLGCLIAALPVLSQTAREADALLERARLQVRENVQRMTRYACTQTIERELLEPADRDGPLTCEQIAALRLRGESRYTTVARDRVRLDLIVASGMEQHQWTGGGVVSKEDLAAIVYGGTLGTGDFSSFTDTIFADSTALIAFDRALEVEGRVVYQYRYSVPLAASHYGLGLLDSPAPVAYSGTLRVDASSAELKQLTVNAERIPKEAGMCTTSSRVDFARTRIRGAEVSMPVMTTLETTLAYFRTANTTRYSQCREFGAHSEISYGDEIRVKKTVEAKGEIVGPGQVLRLRLRSAIDTSTSAAGDVVEAEVVGDQRAIVRGRILALARNTKPKKQVVLHIKFDEIEKDGRKQAIQLAPRGIQWFPGDRLVLHPGWRTRWWVR